MKTTAARVRTKVTEGSLYLPRASRHEIPTKRKFLEEPLTAPNKTQSIGQATTAPIKALAKRDLDTVPKLQGNRASSTTRPNKPQPDKTHLRVRPTCLLDLNPTQQLLTRVAKDKVLGTDPAATTHLIQVAGREKDKPRYTRDKSPLDNLCRETAAVIAIRNQDETFPRVKQGVCNCSAQPYNYVFRQIATFLQ